LLLAAPAGARPTMGLDPGYRTGVKVAVVTGTGQVATTATIYPHEPQRRWDEAIAQLARLAREHRVELIAIGNGTASRETDRLGAELIRLHSELELTKVVVSEAGASVYSASTFGSQELPDLDVSLRGAVSIARRLQDPLAELVKIDPQSIGVGQYQHDLSEHKLSRSLDAVVEDCVNAVGVDVNTASTPLLPRDSGIGEGLALSLTGYREPRPACQTANVLVGVDKLEDLKSGMVLEGVVTNVAAFGAFVDVGVHQDGLVHISEMASAYVKDPRKIAKPGDVVRVKVLEIE